MRDTSDSEIFKFMGMMNRIQQLNALSITMSRLDRPPRIPGESWYSITNPFDSRNEGREAFARVRVAESTLLRKYGITVHVPDESLPMPSDPSGEEARAQANAREVIRSQFNRVAESIEQKDANAQAAIGHQINIMNSLFIQKFGYKQAFQNIGLDFQADYINKLHDMQLRASNDARDDNVAAGIYLFKTWLGVVSKGDEELDSEFGEYLAELSKKGEWLGSTGASTMGHGGRASSSSAAQMPENPPTVAERFDQMHMDWRDKWDEGEIDTDDYHQGIRRLLLQEVRETVREMLEEHGKR